MDQDQISAMMKALSAPFPSKAIHFRVGATTKDKQSGIALAYIDARDAMERLDAVVGPGNWQRRYPWSNAPRLYCEVGIRIGGDWVFKGDGAGDTDVEADKGAFSDAFKRACVNWGIARYLYDMPNAWFPLAPAGRSYKFDKPVIEDIRNRYEAWSQKYFQQRGQ